MKMMDKIDTTMSKIQSLSAKVAEVLEKAISFYQFEDYEGGRRVIIILTAAIFGLLFFPSGFTQKVALFYFGYLQFIESPLFKKFPRLKQNFSFTTKLWKRLPNQRQKEFRF